MDEEAMFGQPCYTKVLRMASNPYQIGEKTWVNWAERNLSDGMGATQSENPLDDSEGLFEYEEDEVVMSGGVPLRKWLVTGYGFGDAFNTSTNDEGSTDTILNEVSPKG